MGNSELYFCLVAILLFTICLFIFEEKSFEPYTKSQHQNEVAKQYWKTQAEKIKKRRHLFSKSVNAMTEPVPSSIKDLENLDVSKHLQAKLKLFGPTKLSCQVQKTDQKKQNCLFLHEMKERKRQIKRICNDHNDKDSTKIKAANLLVMKYRKMIWCPVYKAASSSWMNQIPLLTNYRKSQIKIFKQKYIQSNNLAYALAPPLPIIELKHFIDSKKTVKFLIVRNPLDRLLSAYRDKFELKNQYFHDHFGAQIVAKYRGLGNERFGSEFYKVNGSFNGCPLGDLECKSKRGNGSTPTFWEFVKSLLEDGISDSHWVPIHTTCSVCHIDYDFILKFENLQEEERNMLEILDLQDTIKPLIVHQNTRALMIEEKQKYFEMLNHQELKQLKQFYALDIQLFGYSFVDNFG